ncbi:hypothetical protein [Stenotrophomonas sp.]|uniref:hypothetical protein n=1 Tax=Stenotrophomonas sp. TaxID=69392 RepID=UPI0028ADBB1D|nr:hypothetical protein [Stenotrophomonas sp.]
MQIRLLPLALLAFACVEAHAVEDAAPQEPAAAVERPARIRLFGQNGVGLTMYTNALCEKQYDEEIEASGSIGHYFKAMVRKKPENISIGMPETDDTRNLATRDKLWASPYYSEHPLVPGQPVRLQANIANGSGWTCNRGRGIEISFVPEPGMDYEGDMIRDFEGGHCGIALRQVAADGTVTPLVGRLMPPKCPAEPAPAPSLMVMMMDADNLQYRLAEEGAGIDELDNDEDSVEDLEEMIAEAPLAGGMPLCIVTSGDADASEFGKKLPALLEKRGVQSQVVRVDGKALAAEWGLTEQRPLNFALAEHYCRSVTRRN